MMPKLALRRLAALAAMTLITASALALPAAASADTAQVSAKALPAGEVCYKDGTGYSCFTKALQVPPTKQCYDAGGAACYPRSDQVSIRTIPAADSCFQAGVKGYYICGQTPPTPAPPPPPQQTPGMVPKS